MIAALIVFVIVAGIVAAAAFSAMRLPGSLASRCMERRLREVSSRDFDTAPGTQSFVRHQASGPMPALDRVFGGSGSSLSQLIEQSGVQTTPSSVILISFFLGVMLALLALVLVRQPFAWPIAMVAGFA